MVQFQIRVSSVAMLAWMDGIGCRAEDLWAYNWLLTHVVEDGRMNRWRRPAASLRGGWKCPPVCDYETPHESHCSFQVTMEVASPCILL